jgi:hypothetical protein
VQAQVAPKPVDDRCHSGSYRAIRQEVGLSLRSAPLSLHWLAQINS